MLIVTSVVCLLPIIGGLVIWNELPESVPTHFNMQGEPDGFMAKSFFVFALPCLMAGLNAFAQLVFILKSNEKYPRKFMRFFAWVIPILTFFCYGISVMFSLGKDVMIISSAQIVFAFVYIILGNYLPTIPNSLVNIPFAGERDSSEYDDKKRKIAMLMIVVGAVNLVTAFFTWGFWVLIASLGVFLVASIIIGASKGK